MKSLLSPPAPAVRLAEVHGAGPGLRAALDLLQTRLSRGALTIAGPLGPNEALCEKFRRLGLREADAWSFRAATRTVVVPPRGLPKSVKEQWKAAGHELLDLTLPEVRRAQTSLQLLAAEGCRPVVAGVAGDPEALAVAGDLKGAAIASDADEAARLAFSPKIGVVAQPGFSARRSRMIADGLRQRHRDARITFLDTTSPVMVERDRSVEGLSRWADFVMVVGEATDASCRALIETAQRLGLPCSLVSDLTDPVPPGSWRIAVTAGEFTPSESVAAWVEKLSREAA